MASRVSTQREANTLAVKVEHSLDPNLYDLPLTARTTIPSDWRVARFVQGTETRWLPVHRRDGEVFVQYRIRPNAPAQIERADGGNTQAIP
jgi:hypothetical protein